MSLNSLLRQTVVIHNPAASRDLHGKTSLGGPLTYRARVERVSKSFINAQHEREPYHAMAILPAAADVEREAKLIHEDQEYRVIEIADAPGRNGRIHHYELKCQLWSFKS